MFSDWTTYLGVCPYGKLILSFSATAGHLSSMCGVLQNFFHSCCHVNWCCHHTGLIQASLLLSCHRCIFCVISRDIYLATGILVLWLLQDFLPPPWLFLCLRYKDVLQLYPHKNLNKRFFYNIYIIKMIRFMKEIRKLTKYTDIEKLGTVLIWLLSKWLVESVQSQ